MRLIVPSVVIAALLGLSASIASAGTTGTLSGVVRDEQTGAPIANAVVRANSLSQIGIAKTDARGNFVFLSLIPGAYLVTVGRNGYWPAPQRVVAIHAEAPEHLTLTLAMIPEGVMIDRWQHAGDNTSPTQDVYATSRAPGNLVPAGTTAIIDDGTDWPTDLTFADLTRYTDYRFDGYLLPWSNGFFIEMTPGITFGAGAPMMH